MDHTQSVEAAGAYVLRTSPPALVGLYSAAAVVDTVAERGHPLRPEAAARKPRFIKCPVRLSSDGENGYVLCIVLVRILLVLNGPYYRFCRSAGIITPYWN